MRETIDVLYACDEGYARPIGVSVLSLLESHRDGERVRIHLIDGGLCRESVTRLRRMVETFPHAEMRLIDPLEALTRLEIRPAWPIPRVSYARLFVGRVMPDDAERVLYLDGDTLIRDSLSSLWETGLGGRPLGAVQDLVGGEVKEAVGRRRTDPYFNAGVLLVDVRAWRARRMEEKCLDFLRSREGRVIHHDQGILNGVLQGDWHCLPIRYNLMTNHYMLSQQRYRRYARDPAAFYPPGEVEEALRRPTVLHFTPGFTSHPWEVHCRHPLRESYREVMARTPWGDTTPDRDLRTWYQRLICFGYRHTGRWA